MTTPPPRSALLRPTEVCRMLGVSRSWLYQAAADGLIPSLRLGSASGPLRFHPEDLAAWIDHARASWQLGDSTIDTLRRAAQG